ncbi:hypothetical protein J7M00_02725 [bacterium]|nr:hypothetical protein [bacterium]
MTHKTTFAVVLALLFSAVVFADPPRIMNYQAKLTNSSGVALDGNYTIDFRIYAVETGGSPIWHQKKTVTVTNGLFDVQLNLSLTGDTEDEDTSRGDTLKFDRPYWITLEVGSDGEMSPREKLAPVSFAFRSIYADTADYASGSLQKQDFRLGPEGTSSRIRGLVSSCNELPSSGNLSWIEVTDHTAVPYNFCVTQPTTNWQDPWYAAEAACEDLGGRLCTVSELWSYSSQTGTDVTLYWTAGLVPDGSGRYSMYLCNEPQCRDIYIATPQHTIDNKHSYCCCVPLK